MKKNKKIKPSLMSYLLYGKGWMLVVIILIFLGFLIFISTKEQPKYDPSKHICDEFIHVASTIPNLPFNVEQMKLLENHYGVVDDVFKEEKGGQTYWVANVCNNKFHDKTFCDKCVDYGWYLITDSYGGPAAMEKCKEECICQERTESRYDGYYLCYRENGQDGGQDFKNISESELQSMEDEYLNDCVGLQMSVYAVQHSVCLSARLRNPCEKGDDKWIETIKYSYKNDGFVIDNVSYRCAEFPYTWKNVSLYDEWCFEETKGCREKSPCEANDEEYTLDGRCYGDVYEDETNGERVCSTGWEEFCRKKNEFEKMRDELEKYDCDKLTCDMLNSNWFKKDSDVCDYYNEDDDQLREYFSLKGCKV